MRKQPSPDPVDQVRKQKQKYGHLGNKFTLKIIDFLVSSL